MVHTETFFPKIITSMICITCTRETVQERETKEVVVVAIIILVLKLSSFKQPLQQSEVTARKFTAY